MVIWNHPLVGKSVEGVFGVSIGSSEVASTCINSRISHKYFSAIKPIESTVRHYQSHFCNWWSNCLAQWLRFLILVQGIPTATRFEPKIKYKLHLAPLLHSDFSKENKALAVSFDQGKAWLIYTSQKKKARTHKSGQNFEPGYYTVT